MDLNSIRAELKNKTDEELSLMLTDIRTNRRKSVKNPEKEKKVSKQKEDKTVSKLQSLSKEEQNALLKSLGITPKETKKEEA